MIREEAKFIFQGNALKQLDELKDDCGLPDRLETLQHAIRALRSLRKIARTATRLEQEGNKIMIRRNGKLYDITNIVRKMTV